MIAETPQPPYYAVIFTSIKNDAAEEGYDATSDLMVALAQEQPGYLGHEAARNEVGITVSYWQNVEAIKRWKQQTDHIIAQQMGRKQWYKSYEVRICLVERDYSFEKV